MAGVLLASRSVAGDDSAGAVRFVKTADSRFDRFTRAPSPAEREWMRGHYWRMRCYAPYFDSRLDWFPRAWVYKNLYGVPLDAPLVREHPEWLLHDARGKRLYVRYECHGEACSQYAADVGAPAYRAHWIAEARSLLARGYTGLFVDDVNMMLSRVSDGAGRAVPPHDERTGTAMVERDWRRYVAEFTEQIRAAFPEREIVHNAIWYAGHDDEFVRRELEVADVLNLERGVNDTGLTGGTGPYGLETFLAHVDWLHTHGKWVVFDAGATTDEARQYGLAAYFLASRGRDGIGNDPGGTPVDWWKGYDVRLGAARGDRYRWHGVLRRDFERGLVLLNEPGAPAVTLRLDRDYAEVAGGRRSAVTLGPAQGVVLMTNITVSSSIAWRRPASTAPRPGVTQPSGGSRSPRACSSRTAPRVRGARRGSRASRGGSRSRPPSPAA